MAPTEPVPYAPGDQCAFASLIEDVHAEFGIGYDPRLDADLADPSAHYRHVWVLRVNDAVVGSVALTAPAQGTTTLKRMYLRRGLRGQGWGRRLLSTAIDAAVRDGCHCIRLDTTARQRDACRLYEAAGFRLVREAGQTRYYAKDLAGGVASQ